MSPCRIAYYPNNTPLLCPCQHPLPRLISHTGRALSFRFLSLMPYCFGYKTAARFPTKKERHRRSDATLCMKPTKRLRVPCSLRFFRIPALRTRRRSGRRRCPATRAAPCSSSRSSNRRTECGFPRQSPRRRAPSRSRECRGTLPRPVRRLRSCRCRLPRSAHRQS